MINNSVTLGLGLLSIGRTWGVSQGKPPNETDAIKLISEAVKLGIQFFDTAPAYGCSERLLGSYLSQAEDEADNLIIATKMGEHWIDSSETTFVDHSFDALKKSIDNSLTLLGRIDVLQIHKSTAENLNSKDVLKAMAYAQSLGISSFGASISSIEAAKVACKSNNFSYIQFPFNIYRQELSEVFDEVKTYNMIPIINRPLAMGQVPLDMHTDSKQAILEAITFIKDHMDQGVIITGTRSPVHLAQTLSVF